MLQEEQNLAVRLSPFFFSLAFRLGAHKRISAVWPSRLMCFQIFLFRKTDRSPYLGSQSRDPSKGRVTRLPNQASTTNLQISSAIGGKDR